MWAGGAGRGAGCQHVKYVYIYCVMLSCSTVSWECCARPVFTPLHVYRLLTVSKNCYLWLLALCHTSWIFFASNSNTLCTQYTLMSTLSSRPWYKFIFQHYRPSAQWIFCQFNLDSNVSRHAFVKRQARVIHTKEKITFLNTQNTSHCNENHILFKVWDQNYWLMPAH